LLWLTGHVGDKLLNARSRFVTSLYAKPHGLESISSHILLKHLRLLSFIVIQGEFQSKQDFKKKDRTNSFSGKIKLFYSK